MEDIRYRKNIEGELVFIGTDYTALKTRLDAGDTHLPFKVSKGLTILVSGTIELVGEWDTAAKVARLNFVQDDKYTKLLRNLDTEINLFDYIKYSPYNELLKVSNFEFESDLRNRHVAVKLWLTSTLYYDEEIINHDDDFYKCTSGHTSSSLSEPGVGAGWETVWSLMTAGEVEDFLDEDLNFDNYLRCLSALGPMDWAKDVEYKETVINNNTDQTTNHIYYSEVDKQDEHFVLHNHVWYVCFNAHTSDDADEPGVGANWQLYWKAVFTPYIYYQEYAPYKFDSAVYSDLSKDWVFGACTTDTYLYAVVGIKMFDLLKIGLGMADSTVLINEMGSNGYLEYIEDNYFDKFYIYLYAGAVFPQMIGHPEKEPKIKLSEIIDWYKQTFNCDWKLTGQYFQFKHASEVPTAVGVDLTAFESQNWSILKYTYDPTDKICKESWKFGESKKPDFSQVWIEYENGYFDKKEVSNKFNTDGEHFGEPSGYMIYTADGDLSVNTISEEVGLLSEVTELNGLLAPTLLIIDHYMAGRPFSDYEDWIGNDQQGLTLTARRQRKVLIEAPLQDFEDFDPETELIETDLANLEAVKIIIPLSGKMAQIESVW
jgi:hypothetical protein